MRLCSICDKKIEGGWCKNCHRFVKVYELSEGIHLNERHDPADDFGCTYHTENIGGVTKTAASVKTATYTKPASTATTAPNRTAGKSTGKKKGKGVAIVIAVVYILIMCVGKLLPEIVDAIDSFIEEMSYGIEENDYRDDSIYWEEEVEVPKPELNVFVRNTELQLLTPEEVLQEDGYTVTYYNPEDIKELGYPCDNTHFALTRKEFEAWLDETVETPYEVYESALAGDHYCFEQDEETWVQFSSYSDYTLAEECYARLDYDTATEQVHMLGFVSSMPEEEVWLYYGALLECAPETEWSEDEFSDGLWNAIKETEETGTYAVFCPSDRTAVNVAESEGNYTIIISPMYEE